MNNAELQHYGVLGMKWGRRKSDSKAIGKTRRIKEKDRPGSEDFERVKSIRTKSLKDMSNSEIQTVVNRMNLEQQYSRLNPSAKARGKKMVAEKLGKIGKKIADKLTDQAINRLIKQMEQR